MSKTNNDSHSCATQSQRLNKECQMNSERDRIDATEAATKRTKARWEKYIPIKFIQEKSWECASVHIEFDVQRKRECDAAITVVEDEKCQIELECETHEENAISDFRQWHTHTKQRHIAQYIAQVNRRHQVRFGIRHLNLFRRDKLSLACDHKKQMERASLRTHGREIRREREKNQCTSKGRNFLCVRIIMMIGVATHPSLYLEIGIQCLAVAQSIRNCPPYTNTHTTVRIVCRHSQLTALGDHVGVFGGFRPIRQSVSTGTSEYAMTPIYFEWSTNDWMSRRMCVLCWAPWARKPLNKSENSIVCS